MQPGKKLANGLLPICFCLLAILVAACGGGTQNQQQGTSGPTKAADDKQILILPISGRSDIKNFDPARAGDIPSINAVDMVFTGLVTLNDNLEVQDQLAASHKVDEAGTTWTFTLKDGLKFSDGSPLTSQDVVYSIDRALQPATKSGTASLYLGLIQGADELLDGKIKTIIGSGVIAPDDKTVIIKTKQKAAYFLNTLTYPASYVVQKSLIDKYGDKFVDHLDERMGGAGPWKVSKYTRGTAIEFVPNENYYGPKPQLKKVVMPFYAESDTTYRVYQTDQVHSAGIPSSQLASAKSLPNNQYHQTPLLATYFIGMNYLNKPFDNIKIRQAFALAINKDTIAHNVYKDTVIATNHIVPKGMPGYYEGLTAPGGVKGTQGDPAMAKKLFEEGMKEAGYTLANFPSVTMAVSTKGDTDIRNQFAALQQMWKSTLGVEVKLNDMDFATLLDEIDKAENNPKGPQMWTADWYADYPDPQNWITLLFGKGANKNDMNYGQNNGPYAKDQQAVQAKMLEADATLDEASRMKMYNEIEQKLIDDAAWIPLYQVTDTFVRKPCVVGVVDNAQGLTPPDDWGKIYISTATPCADVSKYNR